MHVTSILSAKGHQAKAIPTYVRSEGSLPAILMNDMIDAVLGTVDNQDSPVLQDTAIRCLRIDTFIRRVIIQKIVCRIHILTNNASTIKFKMREL